MPRARAGAASSANRSRVACSWSGRGTSWRSECAAVVAIVGADPHERKSSTGVVGQRHAVIGAIAERLDQRGVVGVAVRHHGVDRRGFGDQVERALDPLVEDRVRPHLDAVEGSRRTLRERRGRYSCGGADGGGGDQRLEEGAAVSVNWIGHTGIMAQPAPAYQLPAPSSQLRSELEAGNWKLETAYTVPVRTPSHAIPLTAIALVLALSVATGGQVGPSTGAPPGPRTGMIVGQVVDRRHRRAGERGHRQADDAEVSSRPPTTPKGRVMADGEGRFFFTDLPRGRVLPASRRRTAMRPGATASAGPGARASSCRSARASGSRTSSSGCGSTASSPARSWTKPASRSSASRCGRSSRTSSPAARGTATWR